MVRGFIWDDRTARSVVAGEMWRLFHTAGWFVRSQSRSWEKLELDQKNKSIVFRTVIFEFCVKILMASEQFKMQVMHMIKHIQCAKAFKREWDSRQQQKEWWRSDEERKPLQKRWQFDDSDCSRWNGNKPAKIWNIHHHASWNDLTQEEKTAYCHVTSLNGNTVKCFIHILKICFAQTSDGNPAIDCRSSLHPTRFHRSIRSVCIFYNINHNFWINL